MALVMVINRSTPMVRRARPPKNGAKPDTVAPSRFNTPTVEARSEAGTISNAAAA